MATLVDFRLLHLESVDRVRRYCFFGAVFGIIHANLRLSQEVFPVAGALIVGA